MLTMPPGHRQLDGFRLRILPPRSDHCHGRHCNPRPTRSEGQLLLHKHPRAAAPCLHDPDQPSNARWRWHDLVATGGPDRCSSVRLPEQNLARVWWDPKRAGHTQLVPPGHSVPTSGQQRIWHCCSFVSVVWEQYGGIKGTFTGLVADTRSWSSPGLRNAHG